jgi:hypothetical protein
MLNVGVEANAGRDPLIPNEVLEIEPMTFEPLASAGNEDRDTGTFPWSLASTMDSDTPEDFAPRDAGSFADIAETVEFSAIPEGSISCAGIV